MDQTDNKLPCIVQALRAAAASAVQTPTAPAVARIQPLPSGNSSRCTRSQAAPDWSAADTLALVEQVAAVDTEAWSRSLSSFQKWKIIAGNCAQLGLGRSSNQCKRRWELLLADYVKIRKWETRHKSHNGSGSISYWNSDPIGREKCGLPGSFDKEVYSAIDAVIKVEEIEFHGARSSKDVDSELLSVGPIDQLDDDDDVADPSTDLKAEESLRLGPEKILAWELAVKLQENVDQVRNVLRTDEKETENLVKCEVTENVAGKKAEDLIESFGVLVQNLDRFSEIIKSNGFENIVI
ncbi:hypothetical protein LUZ60_017270 [Juncus effusus]|nr:hypothetical protein LUZ60_017270 [Juncus effusus]